MYWTILVGHLGSKIDFDRYDKKFKMTHCLMFYNKFKYKKNAAYHVCVIKVHIVNKKTVKFKFIHQRLLFTF